MKLLFLQETDWLRRYPAQQHHLAEMMSLRGHQVRAIDYELLWKAQDRHGLYSRRQVFDHVTKIHQGASITIVRPGFIKLPLLDYVSMLSCHRKEIARQIKEYQPDAIIGLGILNSYMAARAVRRTRIPFIYYWIDILHLLIPAKPFRMLGKWVESAALKRADRILTINDRLKDFVLGMGAPDGRTRVLRAGIDTRQFNQSVDGNAIRKQYGLSGQDIVLFFMGWLYQFSGLREVARQLAANRNNSLKLLIVGEGDTYEELKAIREKHNLQDKLLLAGQKPYSELPQFIAAADICLLPAYPHEPVMQDIVPIKLYEYMAMKKPVIATRLPGVMREFGDDNGLLYVDRPEDVVGKAIQLTANGNINELGAKARSFAEKNSWEKITSEFERLLEEVIKEKQNGRLSKGV